MQERDAHPLRAMVLGLGRATVLSAPLATLPAQGHRGAVVDYAALRGEVLRVHARYAQEFIEAFDLCPWARGARTAGKVRTEVLFGSEPTLEAALEAIAALTCDSVTDVGLLVLPELTLGRLEFQHFAARVRACGEQSAFAIADFHPEVEPRMESAERLVAYIRKSPDPTLQLVRRATLDLVRRGDPQGTRFVDVKRLGALDALPPQGDPLHARIARANLHTVEREGLDRIAGVLLDISRDRDRSYARLGLPPPPWSASDLPQKQENLDGVE